MREKWIRRPENYFEKVEWRQFYGKEGKWWLDERFYFEDGQLPAHYAEDVERCIGDPDLIDDGTQHSLSARLRHGIIKCLCGAEVHLTSSWANPCACGTEYGDDGHSLTPRSMWRYG